MRIKSNEKISVYYEYDFHRFIDKHNAVVKIIVPTKTKCQVELEEVSRLYLQWWQETHSQRKPWGYQNGEWKLCQNPKCFNAFYLPFSGRRRKESFYCDFSCWDQDQDQRKKPLIWSDEKIAKTVFQINSSGGEITSNFLLKEFPGMYHRLYNRWKRREFYSIQDAIKKIILQDFPKWSDSQKICWFLDGAYYQHPLFFEQLRFFLTKENPVIIADIGKILKEKRVFDGSFFPRAKEILEKFFESENEKELKNLILEVWRS